MPDRLLIACSVPGCPRRAVTRGRCEEHAKRYAKQRPTSTQRGYDVEWRKTRDEFLAYHPKCQATDEAAVRDHARFGDVATDVDHITPKARGGTDDWANLQALCHRCHSRKTIGDMGSKS